MKPPVLEPLSNDVERLLARERGIPRAAPELRARAMARAEASLVAAGAEPVRTLWRRRLPQLLAATMSVLLAAAAFAAWRRYHAPAVPPVTASPPVEARPSQPAAPAPRTEAEGADQGDSEQGSAEEGKVDVRAQASATPRRPLANDSYAAELALLQKARAAVARGESSAALAAIAEHQRRFPSGRLREEREALRVRALSELGRQDEARRAAERFRREFPRSVLSSSIEPPPAP